MSKFKEGDYVILREDARYPMNGTLWSTIDDKLVPGELFRVNSVGKFSWNGKPGQDCVGLENSSSGWIPEICLDPVQIHHFEEGEWVECYRLPNTQDWCVTSCGQISYKFKVGEKYQVSKSSTGGNIKILINSKSEGWYPPTVFRKTILPVQELPQKWKVKCKASDKDTPELKEWRGMEWTCVGYITNDKIWNFPDSTSDKYTEISYETFLEKVYKPWKASQSLPSLTDIISLPDKWAYQITAEDDLKLLNEYRRDGASYCLSKNLEVGWLIFPFHNDGSKYYSNTSARFAEDYPNITVIPRKMFYSLVLNPWIEKNKTKKEVQPITSLPEKWVYSLQNETPDRLKLIQEWRLSVCEKTYRSYNLNSIYSVCNHEDGSYFYSGGTTSYIRNYESALEITKEIFDKFVLQPWIDKGKPTPIIPQQETPKSSDSKIVTTRDIGARVVRGRDWDWGNQDNNTTGTIIEGGGSSGWTRVKWDNGDENCYRIGDSNKYDLYYAEDQTPSTVKQYPLTYSEITVPIGTPIFSTTSYQSVLSSTPHLIINKPKKRLLSTEVQELNVNLKLLKTP